MNGRLMRALVFDMDGLMFNTEELYTLAGTELLRRRGHRFTDALKNEMMGLQPQPSFEIMIRRCNLHETWQELAEESNQLFINVLEGNLAPLPGLLTLLGALERAGIPKAIGTSSARKLVHACLTPFDLERRFQFILTAEDITHGKPHPRDLSDRGPAVRGASGGDDGVGGQPERLPGGCRGGGIYRGCARPAQPRTRLRRRLPDRSKPGRRPALRGPGHSH